MSVKPVEDGMHTVTPFLVCAGAAQAIEFYKRAFGATERMRLEDPSGNIGHAELQIGDSVVMLTEQCEEMQARSPLALGGTPVMLHLSVDGVDAWYQRALDAGATSRMAPEDMFWGDRYALVQDPFGHQWSMATHIRDVSIEEMREQFSKASSATA